MYESRRTAASAGEPPRDRKGLSCAECRRSKLKCDRVFPCQSCIRRGCGHLCPDGTLAATKGNKVLMAHAHKLTEQVKTQTARIKELEQALSESQAAAGSSSHPLLKGLSEGLRDSESIYETGLSEVSEAIGSLAIGIDGQAKYHGETASSEYFQDLLEHPEQEYTKSREPTELGLPFDILSLVNAFPFGLRDCPYSTLLFVSYIPSRERVVQLADLYYQNVAWMYDPIIREDFMSSIVYPIYGTTGLANLDSIHSHRLSVFFVILAAGSLFDSHPSANFLAEQYHALSRACLSIDPILQEATCATVQALFLLMRYMYTYDRSSNEYRWLLGGLCTRVSQAIGLQRDSAGWGLEPEEVQRRRVMFWELYTHDAWTSVVNGRPPSINHQHTDCRFPDDLDQSVKPSGETEVGWHAWKFRYSANCLSISVQHVFCTRSPSYVTLLELDKKIRQFPLSNHLQSPMQASEAGRAWSSNPRRAMQQYCVVCERESNLLYIHRSCFAQAIREAPQDPLKHKFAPSVLATYRSACRLITSLRGLYPIHPGMTGTVWFFWSGIFSACIVLGALVVESPRCTLSQNAMQELDQTLAFYEEGSRLCRTPATLTMLHKLRQRAQTTFSAFHAGSPNVPLSNRSDAPDELEVLGGRKSVITNKSASNSPNSQAVSSSPQSAAPSFPDTSDEIPSHSLLMEYYDSMGRQSYDPGYNDHHINVPRVEQGHAGGLPHATPGPAHHGLSYPLQTMPPPNSHAHAHEYGIVNIPQGMPAPHYMMSGHAIVPGQDIQPVTHEFNQDEIWRDFIRHLGLNKP